MVLQFFSALEKTVLFQYKFYSLVVAFIGQTWRCVEKETEVFILLNWV